MTATDMAAGTHTVVVSKPGYVAETHKVTLSAKDMSGTLSVTLEAEKAPAPAKSAVGTVIVDSRPKGAHVTMDGHSVGSTPLTLPGQKPGTHTVRVELPGYKALTTTVTVKAGETARVAVTLEPR